MDSPPLVVRIDVPNASLGEDLVFVDGDQSAQGEGGDLFDHDGVAGSVALKDLVRPDPIYFLLGLSGGLQFLLHFGGVLALHQRLGLCQKVGQEDLVVQSIPRDKVLVVIVVPYELWLKLLDIISKNTRHQKACIKSNMKTCVRQVKGANEGIARSST